MFALLAKARGMERAGKDIIHFEIGDPDFDSPQHVKEAAKFALDNNETHYTESIGIPEFREATAAYIKRNLGFSPDLDQVLACPANAVIDFVARCVVNPGEEVIYPDPGFPTYHSVIAYNGMVPVGVSIKEKNNFRMNPEDVRAKVTDKTRLIIMNSPQNPTGSVMTKEEVLEMANIAKEHDVYLLSDETYSKMLYEKEHHSPGVLDECRERTIILGSLSKEYSMSGWRLGYAVGPKDVIEKMSLLLQTILSCLPRFTQLGGVSALTGDQAFLNERMDILQERRDILIGGLNDLDGVSCVTPEAAFYAFANVIKTGITSAKYADRALEEVGVCMLPGECFGEFGNGYVRLSFGSTSKEMIEDALGRLKRIQI